MNKTLLLAAFSIFFISDIKAQGSDPWVFKNEKGGVKVFYRKTADVYELKLVTSIQSTLSGLMALLSEVESYPKWGYKVSESKLVSHISDHESIYYSKLDFPWPLDDRDIIMHNKVEQDAQTRKIVATSVASPDAVARKAGVIRIENARTTWTIVPGSSGWLYVEYYIYSDPGGNIPDWLVNLAIDVGPRETIKNIRKMVIDPKYQSTKLAYIKE
jgi:hypothetical protein